MVKLELTNENTPEDVIAEADKFGHAFDISKLSRDTYLISKSGGYYICEGIRVSEELCKVRIINISGNFLTHPRSGIVNQQDYYDNEMNLYKIFGVSGGGFRPNSTNTGYDELENRYTYPLQDNDKGTWVASTEPATMEWTSDENYGNCYWTDGTDVLSWHGPPNRHFAINTIYNIPGLTEVENVLNSKQYFTCFKNNIYQDGSILATINLDRHLVAGACYQGGVLLVAAVDGTNGYKLKLLKQANNGWTQVGNTFDTSRLKTPAFFSKDGKTMTFDSAVYSVSVDSFTLVTPRQYSYSGTQTEGDDRTTFNKSGIIKGLWCENNISEELNYSVIASKTISGSGEQQTKVVPFVQGGSASSVILNPPDIISIDGGTYAQFRFTANGPYCRAEWGGDADEAGRVKLPASDPCAELSYNAAITLQPSGVTAAYTYSFPAPACSMVMYTTSPTSLGVSGAIGAVTWSSSGGTVVDGVVDVSTACGTITITATDECGCTVTGRVKGASGRLCVTSESWPDPTCQPGCTWNVHHTDRVSSYDEWGSLIGYTDSVYSEQGTIGNYVLFHIIVTTFVCDGTVPGCS